MVMHPLPHLVCYKVCPLFKCDLLWDLLLVDQTFCKPLDNSAEACKNLINRNLSEVELGDQKGELSHPAMIAEPKRKKTRLLFFPGKDSANEKPQTHCLLQPSLLPFPPL